MIQLHAQPLGCECVECVHMCWIVWCVHLQLEVERMGGSVCVWNACSNTWLGVDVCMLLGVIGDGVVSACVNVGGSFCAHGYTGISTPTTIYCKGKGLYIEATLTPDPPFRDSQG